MDKVLLRGNFKLIRFLYVGDKDGKRLFVSNTCCWAGAYMQPCNRITVTRINGITQCYEAFPYNVSLKAYRIKRSNSA